MLPTCNSPICQHTQLVTDWNLESANKWLLKVTVSLRYFLFCYVILWLEVIAKEKLPSFGIYTCMYHCELKAGSRFNHFVQKLVVRCACLLPISEIYTDQFAGFFICSHTDCHAGKRQIYHFLFNFIRKKNHSDQSHHVCRRLSIGH